MSELNLAYKKTNEVFLVQGSKPPQQEPYVYPQIDEKVKM